MKKLIVMLSFALIFIPFSIHSEIFRFKYNNGDKYKLVIKSNIKIYLNNKYQDSYIKESKGILDISKLDKDKYKIIGDFYRFERTMRNTASVGFTIDKTETAEFIIRNDGIFESSSNYSFPPFQNIPFFKTTEINTGDTYIGEGKTGIYVNDKDEVQLVKIPIEMKYMGKGDLFGNKYDYFEVRYNYGSIETGGNIKKAGGLHNLRLYFDSLKGCPVFIVDHFREEFELENGDKMIRDGFYDYFYNDITPMDRTKLIVDLTSDVDKKLLTDLTFKNKKEGVSITVNNLKFKPNSIELLDTEKDKIENIFKMLSKIKDRSFMIIGHTAKSGTEVEQQKLSLERAQTIAGELINRGIKQNRILIQGKGSLEPLAPNDTEENMQKNRRVEIIIMED
jgi:outer membrane protein OmpA-like peptidoglycan-associated protein